MLGERTEQRGLWEADRLYIDHVGRGSFYGLLASMGGQQGGSYQSLSTMRPRSLSEDSFLETKPATQ